MNEEKTMTKDELILEVAKLKVALRQAIDNKDEVIKESKRDEERIAKLRGIIGRLEIDLATIKGYTQRIIQEDIQDNEESGANNDVAEAVFGPSSNGMAGEEHHLPSVFQLPRCDSPSGVEGKDRSSYGGYDRITTPWHEI